MVINAVGELKGTIIAPARLVGTIEQIDNLKGTIDISPSNVSVGQLKAVVSNTVSLIGKLNPTNKLQGILTIPYVVDTINPYIGEYEIVPKIDSQIMRTKNKKMEDDVTVLAIPYYETSNLTGKTVYIGGDYGE